MPRLWDDSLYSGAASFYLAGRLPYPPRLADVLGGRLALDGGGRLFDLGCGPGALTLVLAPWFRQVLAVDADPDMVAVGAAEADRRGITNVTWQQAVAEDLDDGGRFDVVTLAQSFHWMDRPVVAAKVRHWIEPSGCCVHVGARTHEGTGEQVGPHPVPPRARIHDLVAAYLGPHRRAGQQVVTGGHLPDDEESVFRTAGLSGPEVITVHGGDVLDRSEEQVVASVLSLSSAAPHLFGDRFPAFVEDLRMLLREVSPTGVFSEELDDMRLSLWRTSASRA